MDETQDFSGSGAGDATEFPAAELSHEGAATASSPDTTEGADAPGEGAETPRPPAKKRRRGSRGGKRRRKPAGAAGMGAEGEPDDDDDEDDDGDDEGDDESSDSGPDSDAPADRPARAPRAVTAKRPAANRPAAPRPDGQDVELPERIHEGRPSAEAAETALVPKPRIGDTRPAAPPADKGPEKAPGERAPRAKGGNGGKGRQGGNGGGGRQAASPAPAAPADAGGGEAGDGEAGNKKRKRNRGKSSARDVATHDPHVQLDAEALERRKGRERKGRPVGRYMMCVHVGHGLTQVAVLEGRNLIEHYVSRPSDDVGHIHGNIYLGRVQNVLPGMEAAFVDISTPKNAVLYAGDVQYDPEDIVERSKDKPRIEQLLKNRQLILCQVTKNPIGAKGARLTQEVSLPGRFVVLIPNSKTYGISKRLPDDERKRLRSVLDRVKEPEHGLIVRTAAENATEEELRADVIRLNETWREIERRAEQARKANRAQLLYREPDLAVRVIREEFNADYRNIVIDDRELYEEVRRYIEVMNPELAERVEFFDAEAEGLPMYERFHVHEQLHKALDRKVWLASGGSLIIEHTEALTVIDVNTGRNVGTSSLEATVLQNNLEAAQEIARQLRLRDIGGIIVIDFIDMEIKDNRRKVVEAFREALSRDKTRSQVFDISELGLVEMTRKRIGEGLLQSFAEHCPHCEGRGVQINHQLLD